MRYAALILISIIGGITFAANANAQQNLNSLESRLNRMENEMRTMSRAMYKGDVPPPQIAGGVDPQAAAATEIRFNQLEEQLRMMTGRVEEQGYKINQLEQSLNEFMNQTATRLNTPAATAQTPSASTDSIERSIATPAVPDQGQSQQLGTLNGGAPTSPAAAYDQAFAFLQSNDNAGAEQAFSNFITQYPDHSLAANAKYWLGESYFAQGKFEDASRSFARSFQDHPDAPKAPDTLLKLGMSLGEQGMKNEACLTFAELAKRYPDGPASVMQTMNEQKQSYNCD